MRFVVEVRHPFLIVLVDTRLRLGWGWGVLSWRECCMFFVRQGRAARSTRWCPRSGLKSRLLRVLISRLSKALFPLQIEAVQGLPEGGRDE